MHLSSSCLHRSMPAAYEVRRDDGNNMWTFRLDCMEGVIAKLRAAEPSLTIVPVPKRVQDAFRPGKLQRLLPEVFASLMPACSSAQHPAEPVRCGSPAQTRLVQDAHGLLQKPHMWLTGV